MDRLGFCTRCGKGVEPYRPSTVSLNDALEFGTVPSSLDAEPHYWCWFCGEHWLATNLCDTGFGCRACNAFMPHRARYCGACGRGLRPDTEGTGPATR
jgi:hypothetical protein